MARLYSKKHGKSASIKPYALHAREPFVALTNQELEEMIVNLAKKGISPSKIGLILRDLHGVGKVSNTLSGKKITAVLKENGVAPEIPEDLNALIKKSINIRTHRNKFKGDKGAKLRLILNDSKIYRLLRYYQKKEVIAADWKPKLPKTG